VGDIGAVRDSFGHIEYGACRTTAQQVVVNYLNTRGIPARGFARGQAHGTDQRSSMLHASPVDLEEAYQLGFRAVSMALQEGPGWMTTILRQTGEKYAAVYDKVPLEAVASSERFFPESWIDESGTDVTDDFLRYAAPLIGNDWVRIPLENGLQRFARLKPIFAEKKRAPYIPEAY
jgi:ATP-dependent phosphofructokinase / diphosphate-dependent phosphofructokinase